MYYEKHVIIYLEVRRGGEEALGGGRIEMGIVNVLLGGLK